MQQGGGETESQYGEMTPAVTATAATSTHMTQQPAESASPISSRPPATSVTSNLDELMRLSGGGDENEGDRGGGVASGNRWPRQETLALLKIRSEMDAAFRDATVKGPLWDDVSRKLEELGYKRSAKKCKEKFENVHKYYKRTKEGRAGRQDGKTYKFFSQLEALHSSAATTSNVSASLSMPVTTVASSNTNTITLDVAPVSIGIPMPISSVRIPTSHSPSILGMFSPMFPPDLGATIPTAGYIPGSTSTPPAPHRATTTNTNNPIGISFSSNSSSSSPETEDDDDEMDLEGQPSNTAGCSRKRKRQSFTTSHRMMEFFEGLMKQVMQKQEAMQQRFLEVIEKREQDRMIREEAWKRQEMARLAREHELMAQERAISASRDAAIIAFLQKITGQTIQLPPAVTNPAASPAASQPQAAPVVLVSAVPFSPPTQHHLTPSPMAQERRDQQNRQQTQSHHRHQQQQPVKSAELVRYQSSSTSMPSEVVMAIPEQQIPPSQEISGGGSFEPSPARWPKVEVLALIKLRSGLEPRYQEAGPKAPLWEEISAGMKRMGYNRSAKRCKEKWENINKYFKKVKEGNKKRPEDAKTCPYFHELDALYRKKILRSGSTSGGGGGGTSTSSLNISEERQPHRHQQESHKMDPTPTPATNPQEGSNVETIIPASQLTPASESKNKNVSNVDAQVSNVGLPGSLFGEGNGGASNKPEDIVKELINPPGMQEQQRHEHPQPSIGNDFDKIEESMMGSDSDNMDHEEDYDEDEEDDEELEEERNIAYKVEFQRQNANTSNGGGNGAASFLAMVQ